MKYRQKKSPIVSWIEKIESKCTDKIPVKDNNITYIECRRNPGTFCKYHNCPLKTAESTK